MIRLAKVSLLTLVIGAAIFLFVIYFRQQTNLLAETVLPIIAAEKKLSVRSAAVAFTERHHLQATNAGESRMTRISDLRLLGVILDNNNNNAARAIIAVGEKRDVYSLNSVLPLDGEVILEKIFSDQVILNNNGRYESLKLYSASQSRADAPLPAADAPKEVPIFYGRAPGPDEPPPYVPDQQAEEVAFSLVTSKFSGVMNIAIYRSDDSHQLVGYKIGQAKNIEKFNALGLRSDDLITAINGVPVTKTDDILESHKNNAEGPVNLEIERNGSVINVELAQTDN